MIALLLAAVSGPARVAAQRPVSLRSAIETALNRAPRVAVARADSAIGRAKVLTARAYPNPTLALVYTKDVPQYHVELEQPFEWGGVRSARKHAAEASLLAATYNLAAERAALRFDVEVAYVRAAGARDIMRLSVRNAADAAELLRITRARQAAGDASELDVRIAAVFAGQAQNQTFTDSLDAATTLLELQSLMGIQSTAVDIVLTDSLEAITTVSTDSAIALRISAARADLSSEQANLRLARRSVWSGPALRTGFDWHDPETTKNRLLPILGIVLPLPIWDRHRGEIAEARATITRANASLELVQLETRNALAIAERERDVSRLKVERGRAVVQEAERVAALTITAYRDGAQPLASVLEAQRSARDALRDFVVNLQDSRIAEAAFVRAHIVGGPRQ